MALFNINDLRPKFDSGDIIKGFSNYEAIFESQSKTREYDIFLSHSYLNASQILELRKKIEGFDLTVFVDWIDSKKLSRSNVNKETADELRSIMKKCKSLIYAYTLESVYSKWMKWELGFFDGHKGRVAILPIEKEKSNSNYYEGEEYLGLYPYITKEIDEDGKMQLWVNQDSPYKYILFKGWLNGSHPYKRFTK